MDGLRRFGITDNSDKIIAIKVVKNEDYKPYLDFLLKNIEGQEVKLTLEKLKDLSDLKLIKKVSL